MNMNLKHLIGKLNDSTRGALEAAAGLCLSRTHYDIEVEHYLTKLLDSSSNDLAAILKHFGVDASRFSGELARALDRLKSGNARTPALSPTLIKMMTEAWTLGSIDFGAGQVRSGRRACRSRGRAPGPGRAGSTPRGAFQPATVMPRWRARYGARATSWTLSMVTPRSDSYPAVMPS